MLDRIVPPPIDLNAIHQRASELRTIEPKLRRRRRSLLVALLFFVPAVALAIDTRHLWEQAISARLRSEGFNNVEFQRGEPRQLTLQQAQRLSPYHIVLPAGYPARYKFTGLYSVGAQRGNFSANYFDGKHGFMVTLAPNVPNNYYVDQTHIFVTDGSGHIRKEIRPETRVWLVGDEVMVVMSTHLTGAQFDAMKSALHAKDAPKAPKNAIVIH
jgi:hypothetical protein